MAANLYVGSSVVLRCIFRGLAEDLEQGPLDDPDSVIVEVLDSNGVVVTTDTPVNESYAVYTYEWVPNAVGEFTVRFVGTYPTSTVTIPTEFNVIDSTYEEVPDSMTESLGQDVILVFVSTLDPVFIGYDEILIHFPDSDAAEIMELVYHYSLEAQEITGETEATPLMREYVLASVACALSKIYDFGGGGDEVSVRLGDLSITNRGASKTVLTRANASSWCELAYVLRRELQRGTSGIKAIVKGENVITPMPVRVLRRKD
ncbi:MAG TPA: hypothetical protein VJ742_12255 [Nitrososphaera sp.]|nr:hypothetical protein [Nitrososphaera sp.]